MNSIGKSPQTAGLSLLCCLHLIAIACLCLSIYRSFLDAEEVEPRKQLLGDRANTKRLFQSNLHLEILFLNFILNRNLIIHFSLFIWKYSHCAHNVVSCPFKFGFLSIAFWKRLVSTLCESEEQLRRKIFFFLKKSFILMNLHLLSSWYACTK